MIAKTLLDPGLPRSEFGAVVLAVVAGSDLAAGLFFSVLVKSALTRSAP